MKYVLLLCLFLVSCVSIPEMETQGVVMLTPVGDDRGFCAGYAKSPTVVATARHCVQGPEFSVKTRNSTHIVKSVKMSENADIACVFLENPVKVFLKETTEFKPGDPVHTIGHPIGRKWYRTEGTITQFIPHIEVVIDWEVWKLDSMIVTDILVAPGNSGGPLLDSFGRVLGVASLMSNTKPESLFVAVSEAQKLC